MPRRWCATCSRFESGGFDMAMPIALALHAASAVVWVGGMFFAYLVLRPAAAALDPPARLALWDRVLARFFAWVWLSVVVLAASGATMVFAGFGGLASLPQYVRAMMALGALMAAIYAWVYFVPWRRFRAAVAGRDWPAGAQQLNRIRRMVGLNLVLGLITVMTAAGGRYAA
jgi:uncharacterized membrane protein